MWQKFIFIIVFLDIDATRDVWATQMQLQVAIMFIAHAKPFVYEKLCNMFA